MWQLHILTQPTAIIREDLFRQSELLHREIEFAPHPETHCHAMRNRMACITEKAFKGMAESMAEVKHLAYATVEWVGFTYRLLELGTLHNDF